MGLQKRNIYATYCKCGETVQLLMHAMYNVHCMLGVFSRAIKEHKRLFPCELVV